MSKVYWLPRYSTTMQDDKQGRWAIVGHCGNKKQFVDGKAAFWEIVWISKVRDNGFETGKFYIKPNFPYSGKFVFNSVLAAKNAVTRGLNWFISQSK